MSPRSSDIWGPEVIDPGGRTLVVGRGGTVEISLWHPSVSRAHAEVRGTNGNIELRDLGSRFGTRVNGKRATGQVLQEGDRVEFGPVAYEVRGRKLRLLQHSEGIRLEASGLAVDRGGRRLLNGVNLLIGSNQFVGLLGTSGSGKSTLLKCLAGYLPQASGTLSFDDNELPANLDSFRPLVGYVPQDDVVYPTLTARENLDYSLRLRGASLSSSERSETVAGVLDRLGLSKNADMPVATFSGGQRKRLNVGMELLTRPRVLFLDEPTSGLDPASETRLMQFLRELANRGVTVVCATHVMENLMLFDQVIVVAEQTIAFSGPPRDLLARFKVESYPKLYEVLEGTSALVAKERQVIDAGRSAVTRSKILTGIQLIPASPPASQVEVPRLRTTSQIGVQFLRGLRVLGRDRLFLAMLVGQPLVIGLLINLSQLTPTSIRSIFLFAVVTSIWLGLNSTAREIVRERHIYVRERVVGVTPVGYLGAKVLLFGLVGLLQVLLLVVVVRYANFLTAGDASDLAAWSPVFVGLVLWTTYFSAMLLGLAISTLVNTQEAAVAALPLIVLPQLLLSGVATGMDSSGDYSFRSLVLFIEHAPGTSWGFTGWVLRMTSLGTYSRPAMALLQRVRPDQSLTQPAVITLVNWLHLLVLLLATASILVLLFQRQEKRWLEQS